MNRSFRNRRSRLDEELRAGAPQADEVFVRSLTSELGVPRRAHGRSRLVFGSAFAVIVVGAVASFGGVGYAASGADQAAAAAKNAVTHSTSAQGQYRAKKPVQPAPVVKAASVTTKATPAPTVTQPAAASSDTLPFTGLSLIGTLALGGALVGIGIAIRRRESRD